MMMLMMMVMMGRRRSRRRGIRRRKKIMTWLRHCNAITCCYDFAKDKKMTAIIPHYAVISIFS